MRAIGAALRWFLRSGPRWAILAISIVAFLWFVPQIQGEYFSQEVPAEERPALVNEYRRTWAQIIGGIGLLLGLYFTWRRIEISWQELEATRDQQVTERFTRAIDQLGATDDKGRKKLEIRLGGIYALERIARDSLAMENFPGRDYSTVIEVLMAYVRENARWPPDEFSTPTAEQPDPPNPRQPPADIQAILDVLSRREEDRVPEEYRVRLDLRGAALRGANLINAHLECAILQRVHLQWARLTEAHLEEADLRDAYLEHAHLAGAHLEGANLAGAHLEGANLLQAHLERANLSQAHLEGANLHRVHLERAHLAGAHLEGAKLAESHLEDVIIAEARLEGADLLAANLNGAILQRAYLEGADLVGANLERADLWEAHLEGAHLVGANLERANLIGAYLERAVLVDAYLEDAKLAEAHLEGANLLGADLSGADLFGANLSGADLFGANLSGANLSGANLQGAHLEGTSLRRALSNPDLHRSFSLPNNDSDVNISGANLDMTQGLTQAQIDKAHGDETTKLPEALCRPAHWNQRADENPRTR